MQRKSSRTTKLAVKAWLHRSVRWRGAALCSAGARDTYYALLQALPTAEDFGPAALVDVDELPGDGLIMPCGGVGAPLVGLEKIEAGDEEKRLRDLMERHTGRTVAALTGGEIGGGNRQARRSGGSHGPGSSHQRR